MTINLMEKFLSGHNYDVRRTGNGRWIDQKCTMDELCFVADCIVVYLQDGGEQPFTSPDIWHTEYAITNVQTLFCKPNPTNESTKDEYNKFFRQPMKMLVAAGILNEKRKGKGPIQFSVANQAILEHLSLRERNCMEFLCLYIEQTLKDSGLWDAFESFFDEQTKSQYESVKETFCKFCIKYTPINTKTEANRIFTKVLNPLAIKYHKKGTVGGKISGNIITVDQIKYNRPNFRDIGKDKNISRQDYVKAPAPDVVYEYNVEKAKRRVRAYNDKNNSSRSEITDELSVGRIATNIHHIFPKNEFPSIADYVENLIAITSAQHMQKAHPNGNTIKIDRDYQYTCLICKTESIRKNIVDDLGDPLYAFEDFMFVLDTGLTTDHFRYLAENDFNAVLQEIQTNY